MLNSRFSAFRRAGGDRRGFGGSNTFTTAEGGDGTARVTASGADSLLRGSAIYQKVARYADGRYASGEHAAAVAAGGEEAAVAECTAVARGGPVAFPHVAAPAPVGEELAVSRDIVGLGFGTKTYPRGDGLRILQEKKEAKKKWGQKKREERKGAVKPFGARGRALSIASRRDRRTRADQRTMLQTKAGSLYSYHRPY